MVLNFSYRDIQCLTNDNIDDFLHVRDANLSPRPSKFSRTASSAVVLEDKVLVSRHLEDRKLGLGLDLGLAYKSLVWVLVTSPR